MFTEFINKDTAQYGRAHQETVYVSQKLGQNTLPERCWCPEWGAVKRWCKFLHTTFPSMPLFTFGQLSFLFFFFFLSQLLGPKTPPNMCTQIFAKTDPTAEAHGNVSTLFMGWCCLPLWLPRSLPGLVQTGKFSLTSGVVILSLYFSRVQLLPLGLSLECLSEDKASILIHLTNSSCPVHGPLCLLPQ